MTTSLVDGLGARAAVEAVVGKAIEQLQSTPGAKRGIWTEVCKATVLVGYATPDGAGAIAIDRGEYDGFKLLAALEG